jgi:hydrogenase maturation protease
MRTFSSETMTIFPVVRLTELLHRRPVVILGVGSPLRGDDAVGHRLAESLAPFNREGFQSHPVGTAVENAMSWVRQAEGGTLILLDAVFDESLPEGGWAFYPGEQLDSICHTTHSIPLSLLISFWKEEVPNLEIHFLGISIRNNRELSEISAPLRETLTELRTLISANIG